MMTCGYGPRNYGECDCGFDGNFDIYYRPLTSLGDRDSTDAIGLARYCSIQPIGHSTDFSYDSSESPNRNWSIQPADTDVDFTETIFAYHGGGAGGAEKIWVLEKRQKTGVGTETHLTLYDAVARTELWTLDVAAYYNDALTESLGIYRTSGHQQSVNAPFLHRLSIGDSGMRSVKLLGASSTYFEVNSSGTVVHDSTLATGLGAILAPRYFPYAAASDASGPFYAEYSYTSGFLVAGTKTHFGPGAGGGVSEFDMNPYGFAAVCSGGGSTAIWLDGNNVGTISGTVHSIHRAFNAIPYCCVCGVFAGDFLVKIYGAGGILWTSGAQDSKVICDMSSDRWFYLRGPEFAGFGANFDPILKTAMAGLTHPWAAADDEYYSYLVKHDASQAVPGGQWASVGSDYEVGKNPSNPHPLFARGTCDVVHNSITVGGNIPADATEIDQELD
jgi:hypothetical protein